MVPIKKKLCPASRYYLKCPYSRTPTRIVVHNTANDAPAENEISYMLNNDFEVSYHYAVDDREIVQGLPLDRNAWASGDGHGAGNMEGIHIEICYSLSGGPKFAAAEKNAAEFIASLLQQYGWGVDKVTKHQDYDGKYCPHRTLDLGWTRFVNMVKEYLSTEKEEPDLTEAEARKIARGEIEKYFAGLAEKPAPGWAKEALDYAREEGILNGDEGGLRPESYVKRDELAQVELNRERRYREIEDVPDWARDAVQELIGLGVILGTEAIQDGKVTLNMSEAQLRGLVFMKRYVDTRLGGKEGGR